MTVPVNINVTGNPEANIILDKIRFLKGKLFQFPLDTNENIGLLQKKNKSNKETKSKQYSIGISSKWNWREKDEGLNLSARRQQWMQEEFEDTKGAGRQHNGQRKKDKQQSTKHTHKTRDRVTRIPLKPGVNSCAISPIRRLYKL